MPKIVPHICRCCRRRNEGNRKQRPQPYRLEVDSPTVSGPFLRQNPTFGLHYIDCASRQAYNDRHGALRALSMGMEHSSLKTLPVWLYQGKMTCESMVRLLFRSIL